MKQCRKCKETKPYTEFFREKAGKDGYKSRCKQCSNETVRGKYQKKYQVSEDDASRYYAKVMSIQRRLGITPDQYAVLDKEQATCAICGNEFSSTKDKQLDHCHTTGKVRKFLCMKCNWALGLFKDNPDNLRKAADYLEEHK